MDNGQNSPDFENHKSRLESEIGYDFEHDDSSWIKENRMSYKFRKIEEHEKQEIQPTTPVTYHFL